VYKIESSFINNILVCMCDLFITVDTLVSELIELMCTYPDQNKVESTNENKDITNYMEELLVSSSNSFDS
jgi:hypothetical protein